ncbi:hypothetical protein AJ78_02113 [Emergomyces pasteurianus Ep9510]|uniref:Uncharacterized protein n=1 Tax=Emergomyces pasteurianus Ep9510 TaxID=1447872 RepID=A0A1J9PNS9_9EURO|nr:hypothetical protein AJ78_02113 [Emergomyces pasteurianus Ep9510]
MDPRSPNLLCMYQCSLSRYPGWNKVRQQITGWLPFGNLRCDLQGSSVPPAKSPALSSRQNRAFLKLALPPDYQSRPPVAANGRRVVVLKHAEPFPPWTRLHPRVLQPPALVMFVLSSNVVSASYLTVADFVKRQLLPSANMTPMDHSTVTSRPPPRRLYFVRAF